MESQRLAGEFVVATNRFVSTIEQQLSGYTAILNLFQMVMMALAILGAVVMLYTGYMYVINPLGQLQRGLARMETGDFGTRVEVDTNDEFGQVAGGFNRMAATLQSLYTGLEVQGAEQDPAHRGPARHGSKRCTRSAPFWPGPTPSKSCREAFPAACAR